MAADYDPRIVALYDRANPDGPDHDYYRALANRKNAQRILDLGCGTGILTVSFVSPGRSVVGVDPSPSMLAYARQRPGADNVTWIHGKATALAEGEFDFMVMTGNVAQHIIDPQWELSLNALRKAAAEGAVLAFESRNPSARAWEKWAGEAPESSQTPYGVLTEWCQTEVLDEHNVLLRSFNRFEATGELHVEENVLAFRSERQIRAQLVEAGFEVRAVYSDWKSTEFSADKPLMVFEAVAV
ncbi:class I SAM-dependent methyltransferase [Glutamicibacter arilaitensis]|jgi:ubiquinone/menaquinone biosynthesis C-methylase UbiE|uniref:Class I SAM-dependent methyltransferase n=2 Tax=Glutamicibacter arilaitensis TaxID=256701 RepID=A0A4Y8TWX6_9MICC|nr:class I SAM-dependent methyltransferase [Glutamicibacter arilaitensis]TFH56675.1 class I SAM-dependent methyltransferase [Glutamicibacter arilaitensis]